MTRSIGVGQAHSKIILIGEHAVVYGYPAIALPLLNIQVTCQIVPAERPWVLFENDSLSMAVYASLEHLGIEEAAIACRIDSMIPSQRGMGYSAAVSIAAIRAVFDYFGRDLSQETLEILVNRAEMIAHVNPSGLDAKTCLSDQPIKFIRNVGFSELEVNLGAKLVIADTGIHGHTKEAIQKVKELGTAALASFHEIGLLTEYAEKALAQKDAFTLGRILTDCHHHLQAVGVSCPEADQLVELALGSGALGAKMSGGGLGGCIIALAADQEQAEMIAKELRNKGVEELWIENL